MLLPIKSQVIYYKIDLEQLNQVVLFTLDKFLDLIIQY